MKNKFTKKLFIITTLVILAITFIYFLVKPANSIVNLTIKDKIEFINGDSLKLLSLNFLLENAIDKYSFGNFNFKKYDSDNIDKKYLFQNIELSIEKSNKRLNSGIFTTQQFLNYILPYRIRYEKTENWRKIAIDNYQTFYNEDILIHAKNINDELKKIFNYTGSSKANRRLSDLLVDCNGGCFEMSDLAAFTMRANGIPIAIDFAKWSNIRGRHQWNSLIIKDKNIPFVGIESDPVPNFNLDVVTAGFKKFAKVYRKSFLKYENLNSEYNPKKLISNQNYIDVTKEYCNNSNDILIELPNENVNKELFYLCVYDVNKWIPVDFAYAKNNTIKFNNVCPDNIFVLKKRTHEKLTYFKTPFTFNQFGKISFLNTLSDNTQNLKLKFFNSSDRELMRQYAINMEEVVFEKLKENILKENITGIVKNKLTYNLYLWKDKWIQIEEEIAYDGSVKFDNIPKNALYKLESPSNPNSKLNRCFTIDNNGNQKWW